MSKFHGNENIYPKEIVLKVADLEKSEDFYTNIMGFKILEKNKQGISLTANGKDPIISLISPQNPLPTKRDRTGLYHFAILLPSSHDLGLFLKHIGRIGYPIQGGSDHGVSQAIYLEDIDKIGIEVYSDTHIDKWEREGDKINMTTLPLNNKDLIDNSGDAIWEGMPRDTILGHIHLKVADIKEAKRFYIEGLGMDLISEIGSSAVFTSSGGYHHHIAFNIWSGRGLDALEDNRLGMKSYSLTFPNEDILENTIARLGELGYKVSKSDDMIFVEDPSKNLIALKL